MDCNYWHTLRCNCWRIDFIFPKKTELNHQSVREDLKLHLQKLESLHFLVLKYISDCSVFSSRILKISFKNKSEAFLDEYSQAADAILENMAEIVSCQRIYLPEAKAQTEDLNTSMMKLVFAARDHLINYDDKKLSESSEKAQSKCREILKIIEEKIQSVKQSKPNNF